MGELQKRIEALGFEMDETYPNDIAYVKEVLEIIEKAKKEFPDTQVFKDGFVVDETTLDFYRKYLSEVFMWFEKWFGEK